MSTRRVRSARRSEERALEVRYEDLLMDPERVITTIAKFCGVPATERDETLAEGLERTRAFAFRREPSSWHSPATFVCPWTLWLRTLTSSAKR
jgi:hypothetical protein